MPNFTQEQSEKQDCIQQKQSLTKCIKDTCADSAGNYLHSKNPVTPTGTNWEQQHSPSAQHRRNQVINQVILGELWVMIRSHAPAPWEVMGLLKEQSQKTQKPGAGRKSEEMMKITGLVLLQNEFGQPCAASSAEAQQQPQVPTASIPGFSALFLSQIHDNTDYYQLDESLSSLAE